MNKTELIKAMAERSGLSKSDAKKALDAFTEEITEKISNGESVQIVGFGTFLTAERAERECRNPQTGKVMKVAACRVPKFKPGESLKYAANS